jgi:hypothetical protein
VTSVRQLATALRQHAARSAATTGPLAGAASVRRAVVASISTDTTKVTTTDGIPALRLASYPVPTVGDVILTVTTVTGAVVAVGRYPAASEDVWLPLPLASGWTAFGGAYWPPSYCIHGDGTASLCGLAKAPASVTGTTTVGTLPAGAIPASRPHFPTEVNSGLHAGLDIIPGTGAVQINNFSGTAAWAALDVATRFRLK